ncbi:MAG TPA: FtsW/RodA/SpoVE family cell cycle protein [Blastocatellia bacterium]|nr:FtsW/RodA/SpoVE family cell cycle protein [Blastocatellia bacterium]
MQRLNRTSPSLHLLLIVLIFAMAFIGYVAIIWSGQVHGYNASKTVAARDLALFAPLLAIFFWLTRKQRFRGEMILLTAAIFLFAVGQLMQYRLFSDPEYGARSERSEIRQAKAQAVRMLNVQTGYDEDKKKILFPNGEMPKKTELPQLPVYERTLGDILTSVNTYIPLAALAALVIAFRLFKDDKTLLWFQSHALLIGIATLIPFAILAFMSEEGKFLGQTTPWEGVKIFFMLSFAGMLADTYHHLRRTRWGLPPARYFLPFLLVAAMPVIPFFALSDFGQMLVFFGVYVMLYIVAVRKKAQMVYALAVVGLLFALFSGTSLVVGLFSADKKPATAFGVPARVHFRFYQWVHTWEPPPPDTWWWNRDYKRYLQAKGLPEPTYPQEIKRRNLDAWSDKVLQQSQGLFGVNEGGVIGQGLGLGFPETVPISDSDFIYAAIAEETGLGGSLALLIVLGVFVFAGTAISIGAPDMFTKLLAAGFTAFIGFQALVNIGGVLRLLPMTGITLPFVSHGGWSLITSFAMLGILLAFSHRNAIARPVIEPKSEFVPVR